jgi:RND family efflux transporter MFP subunit
MMSDQLSRDLASLKIDRGNEPDRASPRYGRWVLLAGLGVLVTLGYPKAKAYFEGLVFQREVSTAEIFLQSPLSSQVDLTATGYVVPQVTAKVGSKLAGRIAKVNVREGETVSEGQVLFELDPADERTALASARARVQAAAARAHASRAELAEAEAQLQRDSKLVDTGAIAPAVLEDRKLRVESLRKQAEAVEAETRVSQAEAQMSGQQLRNLRIVSPIAGTAVTKPAQLGDVVGATMTLVELVPFDSLLVEVDVPEGRLSQVKTDGPCEVVLDAAPNERLRGKVADFTPRMNRAKATATVKVKLVERPARLWPEMSARVSFLAAELDEKLRKQPAKKVVARSAIVQNDGRPAVWIVEDRKVRKVPVNLGSAMGSNVEVVDGPGPGTLVVLSPPDDLRAGQTIKNASPSDS